MSQTSNSLSGSSLLTARTSPFSRQEYVPLAGHALRLSFLVFSPFPPHVVCAFSCSASFFSAPQAEFEASQRLVQMAGNPYVTFDEPVTDHDLVGHDIHVSRP